MTITPLQESQPGKPSSVLEIPDAANKRLAPGRLAVTLHLTNDSWAVLADGTGTCHLIHTGDRTHPDVWKVGN